MAYAIVTILLSWACLGCCVLPFRHVLWKDKTHVATLAAMSLLPLWPLVFGSSAIVQSDANLLQVPFYMNYKDAISSFSQLPHWNTYLWGGTVGQAHPLFHVLHPTIPLTLVFSPYKAFGLSLWCAFLFSAWFMFVLMKELGQTGRACWIAAAVYTFNGFTIGMLGSWTGPGPEYLYSYAMLPLSLALLARAVNTRRYSYAALFGLSLVLVMNGNLNLMYYGVLLASVLLGYATVAARRAGSLRFHTGVLLVGVGVLALANAIEILPFLEVKEHLSGSRLHSEVQGWRMPTLSWRELPGLVVPGMAGATFGVETKAGLTAFVLALLSLSQLNKRPRHLILAMLVAVGFAVLLMTHSPIRSVMTNVAPFFRRISMVPAIAVFFLVPLSILAGIGATSLRKKSVQLFVTVLLLIELGALSVGRARVFDYAEELNDFPHLAALNPNRVAAPYRVECRSADYAALCPDYAVTHHRIRTVSGNQYQYPLNGIRKLLEHKDRARLLNIRFILSTDEIEEPGFLLKRKIRWTGFDQHRETAIARAVDGVRKESGWDGEVYIYESRWTGHARLAGEEGPSMFDVTYYSPARIEFKGSIPSADTLIVSEPYLPGWLATVDGRDVEVLQLDSGLLGLAIDKGSHSVVLRYAPTSFVVGFWISLITILAITFVTFRNRSELVSTPLMLSGRILFDPLSHAESPCPEK